MFELLLVIFRFLAGFDDAIVVQFNGDLECLNGLTQLRGFPSREFVDFILKFSDFVVQFKQGFLRCLVLVEERLAFIEVVLPLVDVEGQFVFERGIASLKQHRIGQCNAVGNVLGFLRHVTLLGQRGQPFQLLFLEHPDAFEITLDLFLLLGGLADFIVVGGDASNVVQHFAALVGRHLGQTGHVTLKDDVVAVWTSVGCTQQAMEDFLTALLAVEFVGGHWIVGRRQPNAS